MKIIKPILRTVVILALGCLLGSLLVPGVPAQPGPAVPPVIQAGFDLWSKGGGMSGVFDVWQKGGLMEGDRKVATLLSFFRQIERTVGHYRSYEVSQSKVVGPSSEVLYLTLNYERGAVYARFLLYRTERGWVVQNLDFSTRPETLMPWLAFEGVDYTQ